MSGAERGGWMRLGALLLLLLLPFGEGGATPAAQFLAQSLVLLGALGAALLPEPSGRLPLLPRELSRAIPCFLAVVAAAAWGSPYPYASFLRAWDLVIASGVFVLARRIDWDQGGRALLADCLLASASLQAVVVLAGSLASRGPAAVARWGLLNSNHEAAYLGLGILVAAPGALLGTGKGRWPRRAALVLCLAAFTQLDSRGAVLGLGAGALLLVILAGRSMPPRALQAAAAVLILVLGASLAGIVRRFTVSGDPFPYERARIWKADLECFAGHPLLGVGPGIYRHVAHRFNFPLKGVVRYGRNFQTPHSDYLGLLVETGAAGFAAGLLVLAGAFALLRRARAGSDPFATGLLAALPALATQGLVEDLSIRPALLLTIALLAAAASRRGESPAAGAQPSFSPRVRVPFLAAPLALAWVAGVLNPYLAFRGDLAMRHAASLSEMERHFASAVRANPYQAETWRFPAAAFLAARPPVPLTLDLYGRFRRELDQGIRVDSTSADLFLTRARLEDRALKGLFHDAATVGRMLDSYREGIRRVPHDPRPRVELAGILRELGRRREALLEVERGLAEEPSFLAARLLRATLLLETGNREDALKEWRVALRLRDRLATFRADSTYSLDITRDYPPLEKLLQEKLSPS